MSQFDPQPKNDPRTHRPRTRRPPASRPVRPLLGRGEPAGRTRLRPRPPRREARPHGARRAPATRAHEPFRRPRPLHPRRHRGHPRRKVLPADRRLRLDLSRRPRPLRPRLRLRPLSMALARLGGGLSRHRPHDRSRPPAMTRAPAPIIGPEISRGAAAGGGAAPLPGGIPAIRLPYNLPYDLQTPTFRRKDPPWPAMTSSSSAPDRGAMSAPSAAPNWV